jgi:hypothetical protein
MHARGGFTAYNKEAKVLKYVAAGALAAFVVSGPLQHVGVLPQTAVGDLSKQAIKSVLGLTAKDAFAGCKGGGGFGGGGKGGKDFGGKKHGGKDFGNRHGGRDFGRDWDRDRKDKKHDRDD